MAGRTLARLAHSDAAALGALRAGVHGVFLVSALLTDFSNLGRLPATLLRPVGVMQLFPWPLYDALMTPAGMFAFMCLLSASLALSTAGCWTSVTTKTSAALVLFHQGLLRSLGHFNHDEMLGVYFLCVLAFTPCGDRLSIDSWRGRVRERPAGFAYGYPVLLMQVLLAWAYFSSGLLKLRASGLAYFSPDSLPALAIFHSLDNLHDTQFRYAFSLPDYRWLMPWLSGGVLLWELLFPLAVFSRRARLPLLAFGVLFHLATPFVLNVFFPHFLAMYIVFVDWPTVARRLKRFRAGTGRGG